MKLALMQPYFFPYIGYFSLIKHCDRFVLFDTVQYIRDGWIQRNRVLKPAEGWQYIAVPVDRDSMLSRIREVRIRNDPDWKGRIFRQLEHYKKKAPFYREITALLDGALDTSETSIVRLNQRCLKACCDYLGIRRDMEVFSEKGITVDTPENRGEWGLTISRTLGVDEFINPHGGVEMFDLDKYRAAGISVTFTRNNLRPYDQRRQSFEPGLSIVDVLMFNDPAAANALIDDYVTSPTGEFP